MLNRLSAALTASALIALSACDDTDTQFTPPAKMPLVVEGWIEDEAVPVVIVTRAANLSSGVKLDELVERWCKVTVSDGTHSEILPMRINDSYTPKVIYSGMRLKGKVGGKYTLTVVTETDTVKATTTIPPVARIDSIKVTKVDMSEALFTINTYARIDSGKSMYYKFFTQVRNEEDRYYSSFLGTFKADDYKPDRGWVTSKGIHKTFEGHFSPHYHLGDTVSIKLCTLDSAAYGFWQAYETAVSLGGNMFFTAIQTCPTNVEGGLGYWAGYGTSMATVIIR